MRARPRLTAVAAALLVAGCGGGGATSTGPPVQDHVHAAVAGHSPGEILLGTHYGLRISTDGGTTWPEVGDLAHAQLRLLVAAGSGYVAVTAADDGSSLTRYSADGHHWRTSTGMPAGRLVSVLSAGLTPGSVLAEVTDVGVMGSANSGRSWQPLLPTPLPINDIAVGVDGGDLIAYASRAGVFLARGEALVPVFDTATLEGDAQSVARWSACARCVVASVGGAVATSTDAGFHWTSHPTKLPLTDVLSWPGGGSALLGVAPAPASADHGLYLSTDGAATWTRVIDAPLVDHLFLPATPGAPLYAFRWGITLYRSDDAGRSWAVVGPLRS